MLHGDIGVSRIVENVFQHVVLLYEHGLCVVVLYHEVLKVDAYPLHVNLKRHVVVVERLRDVPELLQSFDVVADDAYLLLGVLCQVVHLAYLYYKVLARLLVRQGVKVVKGLGNVNRRKGCLAVERHLQLQACRSVVLQGLGDVVELAVGRTVGYGHCGVEIVVEACAEVYLRQQLGAVLADGVLAFDHVSLVGLQREVPLNAHLQALRQ